MSAYVARLRPTPMGQFLAAERYSSDAGRDLVAVEDRGRQHLSDHYHDSIAVTCRRQILGEVFGELRDWLLRDTRFSSSMAEREAHPAYQAIVTLGEDVIPLLLRELDTRAGHWFLALTDITGDDPVDPAARGNVRAMTSTWQNWGRARGYRW